MVKNYENYAWSTLRIFLGWIFLWPFLDKTFGLGLTTARENAWLLGGSPTNGFLLNATKGPFASFFQSLANNVFIEWLFMIGLLLIGLALILGIGIRIASVTGIILMFLFWLAVLPPAHNPIIDEHIIYAILLFLLPVAGAGRTLGFGKSWSNSRLVRRYGFLE